MGETQKSNSEKVVDAAMVDGIKGFLIGLAGSVGLSLFLQRSCTV
jgi:hypothetical protein